MPTPCTSFNSALAGFPVGAPALQDSNSPSLANLNAGPKDSPASFDRVLAQLDEPTDSTKGDELASPAANPPMTAEQLAMMVALLMPNPAMPPPPVVASPPDSSDGSSLKLMGVEGRSMPELLASGAKTLEYQIISPQAAASSGDTATAGKNGEKAPNVGLPVGLQTPTEAGSDLAGSTASSGEANEATTPSASLFERVPAKGTRPHGPMEVSAARAQPFDANSLTLDKMQETVSAQSNLGLPPASVPPSPSEPVAAAPFSEEDQSASSLGSSSSDTGQSSPALASGNTLPEGAAANSPKGKSSFSDRREKSADLIDAIRSPGGKSPTVRGKNNDLTVDSEQVDKPSKQVGTVAANWGKSMDQDNLQFPAASLPSHSAAFGRSENMTTGEDLKGVVPSHAPELVHEIREIADGLWAVERNSVEVKFNFGEQERLSVKVEYRDGTVHATFRSDSSELRHAIAQEWQAQASGAEQRPYRVADPVFTGAPSTAGSSFGGDASRQQRSPEQSQSTPFSRFISGGTSRSAQSTTPVPSTSPMHRDTNGHLHALV